LPTVARVLVLEGLVVVVPPLLVVVVAFVAGLILDDVEAAVVGAVVVTEPEETGAGVVLTEPGADEADGTASFPQALAAALTLLP
jgi:hypothetical protein